MIFEILKCETKGDGWKVATVKEGVEGGRTFEGVSINKTDRQGKTAFENFDAIDVGLQLEADYWPNPADERKKYLFAPKPKAAARSGAFKTKVIEEAQDRKAEHIKEAQDNRSHGVMIAAAMRDATQIALASFKDQPFPTAEEFSAEFVKWRDWYLATWRATVQKADIPF